MWVETLLEGIKNIKDALKSFGAVQNHSDPDRQNATIRNVENLLEFKSWPQMRKMHVVPSGFMHFIPWGALKVTYPVSVLPILDWLSRPSSEDKSGRAVIVGDPQFGNVLPQLAGARDEARAISKIYEVSSLIGVSATEPTSITGSHDPTALASTGRPSAFHSGYPSSIRLALNPFFRNTATASNAKTQYGPRQ
jgi:hypothetical protein